MDFVGYLETEIEKLDGEQKVIVKQVIGTAVIEAVLRNSSEYIEILKLLDRLEPEVQKLVLRVFEAAKRKMFTVEEIIGEVDGVKVIVVRDGKLHTIYIEKDGSRQWVETYTGKWAYQRARTILKRLQAKKDLNAVLQDSKICRKAMIVED